VLPDGVEILALDGEDILELHPVRFEQTTEAGSIKIKAVQNYRLLRHNVDVTGPRLRGSGGQQGSAAPEPSSGD
jgi:hypothetical protein